MNSLVNDNDIWELVTYIITKEQILYNNNPISSKSDFDTKLKDYREQVEKITEKIAIREEIKVENKKY